MQQEQPAFMQAAMQSQQPWIMLQQFSSPLVQVMQQPSLVMSHLHIPIIKLQQQTIIPFIMQQQLTIPPAIILHMFCIMAQAEGSEQVQVIFMPPWHFSTFIVQRGTITVFIPDMPAGIPIPIPVPDAAVEDEVIGFIIAVTMIVSCAWVKCCFVSCEKIEWVFFRGSIIISLQAGSIATQLVYVSILWLHDPN
jgi:hypothetical protein